MGCLEYVILRRRVVPAGIQHDDLHPRASRWVIQSKHTEERTRHETVGLRITRSLLPCLVPEESVGS